MEPLTPAVGAVQVVLGAVLVAAGTGKILAPPTFEAVLRTSGITVRGARALAVLVPILELVLAGLLVAAGGRALQAAFVSAAVLLTTFCAWMLIVWIRGLELSCGCFGARSHRIDKTSIVRTATFAAVAAACSVFPHGIFSQLSLDSMMVGTVFVAVVAGVVVLGHVRPMLLITDDDVARRSS